MVSLSGTIATSQIFYILIQLQELAARKKELAKADAAKGVGALGALQGSCMVFQRISLLVFNESITTFVLVILLPVVTGFAGDWHVVTTTLALPSHTGDHVLGALSCKTKSANQSKRTKSW